MLRLENVHASYELIEVLKGISLEVNKGDIVTIIGANGAGKTTTLMSISGINKNSKGIIFFNNLEIATLPPHEIVRLGISHVPEGRRIFPRLSVLENLEMGGFLCRDKKEINGRIDMVYSYFPILSERSSQYGGTLSGGEQQMLTIARTLMGDPDLILLDEPSEGLAPIIVKVLGEFIDLIKQEGMTVLLSEQNVKFALKHSDRAYIVDNGHIKYHGSIAELEKNEEIKKRYLAV